MIVNTSNPIYTNNDILPESSNVKQLITSNIFRIANIIKTKIISKQNEIIAFSL